MRVLLATVTNGQQDVSLHHALGFLKLQGELALAQGILADMDAFATLEHALAQFHRGGYDALFVAHGTMGFEPQFVLGALESTHSLVLGVYGLPRVNWSAVTQETANDPLRAAVKDNVDILPGTTRYARVAEIRSMHVFVLKRLKDLVVDEDGVCRACDGGIVADTQQKCTSFGVVVFGGCVGLRHELR